VSTPRSSLDDDPETCRSFGAWHVAVFAKRPFVAVDSSNASRHIDGRASAGSPGAGGGWPEACAFAGRGGAVGRDAVVERVRRGQADAERAEDDHLGRSDVHGGHVRSTPAIAVTPGDGAHDAHADAIACASLAVR
jgi:hypothetical protein